MKQWLTLLVLCLVAGVNAQQTHIFFDHFTYTQLDAALNKPDVEVHTGMKPYRFAEINSKIRVDSVQKTAPMRSKFSRTVLGRKLFSEDLFYVERKDFQLYVNPSFNFQVGRDFADSRTTHVNTRGINVRGNIGKTLSFYTDFYENQAVFLDYISDFANDNQIIPGQGRTKKFKESGYDYGYASGYISYTPIKYINFELGHGKNFIGDGYRSLLLSDAAFNYPYFKITTQFWKIKYVNIFAEFQDITPSLTGDKLNFKKFATFHYLSILVGKRLTLGLFESVVWSGSDSTGVDRGFDINYLNPIIFYRPIEFGLGSNDNALLGLTFKWKVHDNHQLYGQVILDELSISNILGKNGKGWRGNKQGFQLGYKYFNMFGLKNLHLQTEFNYVRPYTYAHYRTNQNYAHYSQPLAHPLGANFWELLGFLRYQHNRWTGEARLSYAVKGLDTAALNYGGNLYNLDINHPNEFGNSVGQGLKATLIYGSLKAGYVINPAYDFRVEAGVVYRSYTSAAFDEQNMWLFFGLRTRIPNLYYDF